MAMLASRSCHSAVFLMLPLGTTLEMIVAPKTPFGKVTYRRSMIFWKTGVTVTNKVVKEPSPTGTDQGLPIVFQHQNVRNVSLDGTPAIQFGIQHSDTKVEYCQGQ